MSRAHCRLCGEEIIRCTLAVSGRILELSVGEVAPSSGIAAYDPRSGLCHILRPSDMRRIELLILDDVTFHHTHPATCSRMEHWRRPIRSGST